MRKYARWAVALLVSGGGIWFALKGVCWAEVVVALKRVQSPERLLVVPLIAGVEYAIRTERWRLLLGESRSRRATLFPVVAGAFFLNNVLPFRAGEAARIFWTHRRLSRPLSGTVAALAVDRIMDGLALAILFLTALTFRPNASLPHGAAWVGAGGGVLVCVFFVVLARYGEEMSQWGATLPIPDFIRRGILSFVAGAAPLRSLGTLVKTLFLSAVLWGMFGGIFFGMAHLFGLPLTWAEAFLLLAGIALGVALPSTPGFIGTYEAAGVATLSLFGYSKSEAFPLVASIHLVQMVGTAVWGAPALFLLLRTGASDVRGRRGDVPFPNVDASEINPLAESRLEEL